MNFKRQRVRDLYLRDTALENIFIAEFLPDAEANYIKVYLIALMYADVEEMTNSLIARHLRLDEEEVLKAWNYWERRGVIRKRYSDPEDKFHYEVEFVSLKDRLYSAGSFKDDEDGGDIRVEGMSDRLVSVMDNSEVRKLLEDVQKTAGRMLEGREAERIVSWMSDEGMSPGFIVRVYMYCAERKKTSFLYVSKIIHEWYDSGIRTPEAVNEYLEENDRRYMEYRTVFKALGFSRNPTEDEKRRMDTWFDDMGFGMDTILSACSKTSGISNPNIRYVHAVLTNWHKGTKPGGRAGGSNNPAEALPENKRKNAIRSVRQYYDNVRKNNESLLAERKSGLYKRIPRLRDIEGELRSLNMQISRHVLSGADENGVLVSDLRGRVASLRKEKSELLEQSGLPEDFLDMHYECAKCRDTGTLENGERCSCFNEKLKELLQKEVV